MNWKNIKALLGAFEFEVQFEREEENKVRFRGNGTFIDVWLGKRGLTIGVYDTSISALKFYRGLDMLRLEKIITNVHEEFYA